MIPLFLRLGPFVFIEFGFLFSAAAISFWLTVSPCFTYALIQLAISIFFIEQIVVYNLIFKSKSLKKKYIGQEVSKWNFKTSLKTFWNIMVFASCCCLIYSWIIQDTINILFESNQSSQSANQCSFQLYPLCFFSQQFNIKNDSLQNTIILTFLLSVFIFIETGLMGVTLGYFITYFKAIKNYQKALIKVNYSLCQTLIESKIIQNTTENTKYRSDPCSICFCQIQNSQSNAIRLRCKHEFHKQCIISWLQTKDHCPFRCQPNELA